MRRTYWISIVVPVITAFFGVVVFSLTYVATKDLLEMLSEGVAVLAILLTESIVFEIRRISSLERHFNHDLGKLVAEIEAKIKPAEIAIVNREEMYEDAAKYVSRATKRLMIAQSTPSIIFHPDKTEQGWKKDLNFLEELARKIDAIHSGSNNQLSILYLFCIHEGTFERRLKEKYSIMKKAGDDYFKEMANLLPSYTGFKDLISSGKTFEEKFLGMFECLFSGNDDKIKIYSGEAGYSLYPLLVSDDEILIWLKQTKRDERLYIRVAHSEMAERLFDHYRRDGGKFVANACLAELATLL